MSEIAIFNKTKYDNRCGNVIIRVASVIKRLVPVFSVALLLVSCSASRRAAADERAALSAKLGVEITKDDNIKLYRYVSSWIGVRYRTGGTTKSGVDCSGFAGAVYNDVYGKKIHRTVVDIYSEDCRHIRQGNLQEGDLVFFRTDGKNSKTPNHVGVYLKNGKFVHASSSRGVVVNSLEQEYYRKEFIKGGRVK
ncbi:MAG: C40 family peptidase [Salinivirgaceae bacterium]|nr:C40 family peptidase [Salinivirgaceae bacterium]